MIATELTHAKPKHAKPVKPHASSAWVSPDGKFYAVDFARHHTFVMENFGDRYSVDDLEDAGWLHLSSTNVYIEGRPTRAQCDTLWDVLAAYAKAGSRLASDISAQLSALLEECE